MESYQLKWKSRLFNEVREAGEIVDRIVSHRDAHSTPRDGRVGTSGVDRGRQANSGSDLI